MGVAPFPAPKHTPPVEVAKQPSFDWLVYTDERTALYASDILQDMTGDLCFVAPCGLRYRVYRADWSGRAVEWI